MLAYEKPKAAEPSHASQAKPLAAKPKKASQAAQAKALALASQADKGWGASDLNLTSLQGPHLM